MDGTVVCRPVADADELAAHHEVRRAVFVDEQRVFAGSDVDAQDAGAETVHVLAWSGTLVVGAVRLFPLDRGAGLWQGDRLAVLAGHRALGAGGPLVRFAVGQAAVLGGTRMLAHVQPANQRFFERLGWTVHGTEVYAGRPHVAMEIALSSAAPRHEVAPPARQCGSASCRQVTLAAGSGAPPGGRG